MKSEYANMSEKGELLPMRFTRYNQGCGDANINEKGRQQDKSDLTFDRKNNADTVVKRQGCKIAILTRNIIEWPDDLRRIYNILMLTAQVRRL